VFPPNMNAEVGFDFSLERRAVYVPAFRNSLDELFQVFDFANPNMVTGNRNTSTLPTQALYLMNSPFVMRQADRAAQRLLEDPTADDERRIVLAYRRAIGREPTQSERELSREFLAAAGALGDAAPDVRRRAWSQFCQSLIACVDFRYLR
ncbi:MAG: DUF1553 domain-containing protein, partial [Planctomycetales bacterium]|nr:DUF1553 domain-containing protein [Planctomycetales bacterium]